MGRDFVKYQNTTRLLKSVFEKALLFKEKKATELEKQHGIAHAETLKTLITLLRIYDGKGDKAKATELRHRTLQGAIEGLSLEDPAFLALQEYMRNYYSKHHNTQALLSITQQLHDKAVIEFGEKDNRSREFQINLLRALRWNNKVDEAVRRGDLLLDSLKYAQPQDERNEVMTVLVKEVTAVAHLEQGMRERPGYQNHYQTAASLFEDVLLSTKARSVMGERWFLRCKRELPICYLGLKLWPQAIQRATEALKATIAIHGRYSEEELEALDLLLSACWRANEYSRSFNLGLMRCDHALQIGKGCTLGVLQVVMDQYELYKKITPTKEQYTKLFNLLWQIREKGQDRNLVNDGHDYGADLDGAIHTLESEAPAYWKAELEGSKSAILDTESLQALLRTNNPETASFKPEEGCERDDQFPSRDSGAAILVSPDWSMRTVPLSSMTSTGIADPDKMTSTHNLCDEIIEKQSESEPAHQKSSTTDIDPNSFLYDEVEQLMADFENDEAKLVSDDMPDEKLFALLEELRARRAEEGYMREVCFPSDNCFKDWPSSSDESGTDSNEEEN